MDPCWITPVSVERVIDGDTVDVTVTRTLRIRLKDCWAPEIDTPEGEGSFDCLYDLLIDDEGEPRRLMLKVDTDDDIKGMLSFGRVVGELYVGGKNVSELMVKAGHATEKKNG